MIGNSQREVQATFVNGLLSLIVIVVSHKSGSSYRR